MKIYIKEKDFFTYRGVGSSKLDLLGLNAYLLMRRNLSAEEGEGEGERVVLYPAFPFLTKEELFSYLDEREGSYSFPGGYVVRGSSNLSELKQRADPPKGGLFTLEEFRAAFKKAEELSARSWAERGALVEEGATVSFLAALGEGVRVERGAKVLGESFVGRGSVISSGSVLVDSVVGEDCEILSSYLLEARLGDRCKVGPNAYLRPNSTVGEGCRIGDFVELKNAKVGAGCKISHLAYVGDAELGDRVNVGCGVVFANYDGKKKSKTKVGSDCFLGSNCNLIAPLTIGDHVFLAAGTTLTKDLSENDFCIGRSRETIFPARGKDYYFPKG